jgi:diacylglycerol kinase (ATP)
VDGGLSDDNPGPTATLPQVPGAPSVAKVAVVAHAGKTLGGGLPELRQVLDQAGHPSPGWYEVRKSKQAPECVRRAIDEGADLIFVWGGDGTVQRCADVVAGSGTALAVIPAGTANLLARNLGIPLDIAEAVAIGLHGPREAIDTGTVNGEHFMVMAGAGLDALMIHEADSGLKDRLGRAAYLWTGARNLDASPVRARVGVEGRRFFKGTTTCVLAGNMGRVLGGIEVFDGSRPDDGLLEVGVVTARTRRQWVRTLTRVAVGRSESSPFVVTARGTSITVKFDRPTPYELDGGTRTAVTKLRIKVHPGAVTLCVPG